LMTVRETRDQSAPVAVVFVDISDSTTLFVQRGDTTAFGLTMECVDLVGAQVKDAGGRFLKQVGDGALAVFDTPAQALRASIRIIQTIEDPTCPLAGEGVRVRSGIDWGPVVLQPDDVHGDVVNVAARLVGRAGPGEIFLSGNAYEALPAELRVNVHLIDQMFLRNRPTPVNVYKYVVDNPLATIRTSARRRALPATMEVMRGDLLLVVGPERPRVSIGRDAGNDICIDDDAVSRNHAEISLRGDRFMLVDRSTNGTYVHADNGHVLRVVREELVLTGAGHIVLGVEAAIEPIRYRVAVL
jgi:class 3 adenylate cyclase